MKIAVISDIHGNMEALEAVLSDIKNENCDKIFILGDLAMAGPEPEETISFIRNIVENDKNIEIIQGNTDEMIVKFTGAIDDKYLPPSPVMAASLKYAQQVISKENAEFLADLPIQKSLKIGQISILLVHGSPRRNNEDIMPGKNIEEIKPILKNVKEDLIFCGHTHLPAGYQIEGQTIVNDGSVGRPLTEDRKACYAILTVPDLSKKEFEIEHKFVEYDNKSASEKLSKLKFTGANNLADML